MCEAAILAGLLEHNRACCDPPLPDREVERIAASLGLYPVKWVAESVVSIGETHDLLHQQLNGLDNAQRLIALSGNDLRYCPPLKKFLAWDRNRWLVDELNRAVKLAQDAMLEFARQAAATGSEAAMRFGGWSLDASCICGLLSQAELHLAVLPEYFDNDPYLLNFANGTLDLRTFELLPHSRINFLTKVVHVDYCPDAKAPRFLKFLDRVLGGVLVQFLQRALGYSITGVTSEKKAFLCLGPTDYGKTTLLNLVRTLFKEYSASILIDALLQRTEDNNSRADLADLRGCRFAMTSETEQNQRLREAKLKRITQGQGRIKRVRKYENPIEFPETHKFWIDANHRPVVRGTDGAIWNRLLPVPFTQPLTKSEVDPTLPEKLLAEAPGIIAWIVDGTRI
jgi:putative DNA primase/helicase